MEGITAIVKLALIAVGSVLFLVVLGAGIYFYYTTTGQEEGE